MNHVEVMHQFALRKEIINKDFYMSSAQDLVNLFKGKQASSTEFEQMYYTGYTSFIRLADTSRGIAYQGIAKSTLHCISSRWHSADAT